MVTVVTNDNCFQLRGLSSDVKPVDFIGNGSTFFEIDTGNEYAFDEENKTWIKLEFPIDNK